jgi:Xaa-Pro aminopeptidase
MTDAAARARYARLQAAMAARGVGACLLAAPHAGAVASGARRVQVAGSGGTVPWVAVTAGAPAAVVFTPDPDGAPDWMPRDHVRPLRWDRAAQLAEIAALVAPTAGAIACDVDADALRAVLPAGRPLVDAAPLLAAAAAPLSDVEVDALRAALGAARAAAGAAAAAVRVEAPVRALHVAAAETFSVAGVGFPLHELLVWSAGETMARLAPAAVPAAGAAVALQAGVRLGDAAGVAGDTVVVGGDAAPLRARWRDACRRLAAACRPGAGTAGIRAAARVAGVGAVGPLAHGLGVGIGPPVVHLDGTADEPLAAGSALVLAPVVREGALAFRATATLLVSRAGPEWLDGMP